MFCTLLGLWCPQIDAFYYPNKHDLTVHQEYLDVGSLENCRATVFAAAAQNGDPQLLRGDYECGVNPMNSYGDLRVYEETIK
ncbi:hypothetical protein PhaeoP83_01776 [Phaeobacter inhibens]|uniref:Uncharacterized protein n=1 Tax=Phaeobacter inhibens TaxID=221822 RepID=A0ABM6RDV6_9RHOB|nr:hypothetical protein PhaeoP83_01776 [Phaeobacter inhibens]AUQ94588.1 hypothetical protein PhaeoP66_01808 [Phaeobacter inhibens]AUR19853.1 hypothetical protein PhaeoP80_01776 [Phaeobacter inhibens]